jgi:hypothetical protein
MTPRLTAINQTPQGSCLDAASHGTVSMGCRKPEESDPEASHGVVSMGWHKPKCSICENEVYVPLGATALLYFDKTILDLQNNLGVSMEHAINERFRCEVVSLAGWCIKQGDVISKSGDFYLIGSFHMTQPFPTRPLSRTLFYVHVFQRKKFKRLTDQTPQKDQTPFQDSNHMESRRAQIGIMIKGSNLD